MHVSVSIKGKAFQDTKDIEIINSLSKQEINQRLEETKLQVINNLPLELDEVEVNLSLGRWC